MIISDKEICAFLQEKKGVLPHTVSGIRRQPFKRGSRSSLVKITVHTTDGPTYRLLEKRTPSSTLPYENHVFENLQTIGVTPAVYLNDYDAQTQTGVLLMEDLTASHTDLRSWEAPVSNEQIQPVLTSIAKLHAANWGNEQTRQVLGLPWHLSSPAHYETHLGYLAKDLRVYMEQATTPIDPRVVEGYESALLFLQDNALHLLERVRNQQGMTYVHGDLHVGNIWYPKDDFGDVCFVDLEAVQMGLCTDDLVRLLVLDLYHGGKQTLEWANTYYQLLPESITKRYSREQFMWDLRHSVMDGLFFPLKVFVHYGVRDDEDLFNNTRDVLEYFCEELA